MANYTNDIKTSSQSNALQKIASAFLILELLLILLFLWYVRLGNIQVYMKLVIASAACLAIGIIFSKISSERGKKTPTQIAKDIVILFVLAAVIALILIFYLSRSSQLPLLSK